MTFELGNLGGFELVICEIAVWQAIRAEHEPHEERAEGREVVGERELSFDLVMVVGSHPKPPDTRPEEPAPQLGRPGFVSCTVAPAVRPPLTASRRLRSLARLPIELSTGLLELYRVG